MCGKKHPGPPAECYHKEDPKRNTTDQDWALSPMGLAMKAKGYDYLVGRLKATALTDVPNYMPLGENLSPLSDLFSKHRFLANVAMRISPIQEDPTLKEAAEMEEPMVEMDLGLRAAKEAGAEVVDTNGLWDSGASKNFISQSLVDSLDKTKFKITNINKNNNSIFGGIRGSTTKASGVIYVKLTFTDELKHERSFNVKMTIIDTDNEVIVGYPTLRQLNLIMFMPSLFFTNEEVVKLLTSRCAWGRRHETLSALSEEAAHVSKRVKLSRSLSTTLGDPSFRQCRRDTNELCTIELISARHLF